MYTFRKPYRDTEFTPEYFQERGELALFRALNIGRVIGFIGSGATMAYGRTSWRDLVITAIEVITRYDAVVFDVENLETREDQKKKKELERPPMSDQYQLLRGLKKRIEDKEDDKDTYILALSLTEELASLLGVSVEVREKIAKRLISGRNATIKEKNSALQTWASDCKFAYDIEPIRTLIEVLGISRFLTLNYDVEIERDFTRLFRFSNREAEKPPATVKDTKRNFRELVKAREDLDPATLPLNHYLDFSDGLGSSVLSVNLSSRNVGELTNFALLPNRYSAQVFHLHGRYDDPETMVLTEQDYLSRYLSTGNDANAFDEALSTVFKGNDVLLVGVGMDEADMFRPLRQFTTNDSRHDLSSRNVYTLRERACRCDVKFTNKDNLSEADWCGEFERNYLKFGTKTTNFDEDEQKRPAYQCYLTDAEFSLKMKSQYGIFTLFYGDESSRLLRCLAECLKSISKLGERDKEMSVGNANALTVTWLFRFFAKKIGDQDTQLFRSDKNKQYERDSLVANLTDQANAVEESGGELTVAKKTLGEWADEFKSLLRARMLDQEFARIKKGQEQWWSDWRKLPEPRSARFRKTYLKDDINSKGAKIHPCLVRHKPEYVNWKPDQASEFMKDSPLFVSLFEAASEAHNGAKGTKFRGRKNHIAKRILRLSMDRGSGKGSLMHLLQQEVRVNGKGQARRRVLDTIFDSTRASNRVQTFRYHGSFLVHLSFSMEFASIIESCARFVQDALIGLFVDERTAVKARNALKKCEPGQRVVDLLKTFEHGALKNLAIPKNRKQAEKEIRKAVNALELGDPPLESLLRNHRIEVCRELINAFTAVSNTMTEQQRLFFYFSGLDELCDENAVAHNPMFRAFFRLLSGNGTKYPNESNPEAPFDLVFISGDPRKPVRYLSEQVSSVTLSKKLERPDGNLPHYVEYQELKNSGIFLRLWKRVDGLRIKDRFWLRDHPSPAVQAYYQFLVDDEEDPAKLKSYSGLRERLKSGVALSSWCAGAIQAALPEFTAGQDEPHIADILDRFDSVADQAGLPGLLAEIVETHYRNFRKEWIGERDADGSHEPWPDARNDLFIAVMKHLALFPIPVELRVLYGCDEINFILHRICNTGSDPNASTSTREQRLDKLSEFLNRLANFSLVIRVQPKIDVDDDEPGRWESVFTRYTLQNQMRDYFARHMDLRVSDRGKQNFFLTSIYCDQPEDLPTPTTKHYRLFRSLVDRQIKQTKHTLWCLHQLHEQNDVGTMPNELHLKSELAFKGLRRRLAGDVSDPTYDELEVDKTLASLCAVSHRIRALYSLLRGSFSVGAITRLEAYDADGFPDQPLERFRGWLRGITNAATSLGHVGGTLDYIGGFAPERPKPEGLKLVFENRGNKDETILKYDGHDGVRSTPISQPLYRDEFGWLLNERGVIALVQGNLFDAVPLFERAIRVMSHREHGSGTDSALHAAVRRVRLNLAIAQVERGNLDKAESMLNDLVLPDDKDGHLGSTVSWMCGGYLGMIRHLGGDLSGALSCYDRIVEKADLKRVLRLQSIFRRLRADLYRRMGDPKAAARDVENSIASAQYSEQRDILWLARLTRVKLKISEHVLDDPKLSEDLIQCVSYARTMSMPRLEADALRIQAELLLRQGDKVLAGNLAASSAGVASRAGLRLLKISAMLHYGRILKERQELKIGERIFNEATREAERRGYLNQVGA